MKRAFNPAGYLFGVAPLAQSPSCTFLKNTLGVVRAGNERAMFGTVSVVERGGAAAIAFALAPEELSPDISDAARRGNLAARAVGETRGDVAIVSGVELIRADGRPMVWPGQFPKESVPDEMQGWWQPAFLSAMGIGTRARPRGRAPRPSVRRVVPMSLHGEIDASTESKLGLDIKLAHGRNIDIEINSPGGDATRSIGLSRALTRHNSHVVASIVGQGSSGAALVALAADERRIDCRAKMLLHRPVITRPNGAPFVDQMEVISTVMGRMSEIIADATGHSRSTARKWLNAEVEFNADMALQAGLATSIVNTPLYLETDA